MKTKKGSKKNAASQKGGVAVVTPRDIAGVILTRRDREDWLNRLREDPRSVR